MNISWFCSTFVLFFFGGGGGGGGGGGDGGGGGGTFSICGHYSYF